MGIQESILSSASHPSSSTAEAKAEKEVEKEVEKEEIDMPNLDGESSDEEDLDGETSIQVMDEAPIKPSRRKGSDQMRPTEGRAKSRGEAEMRPSVVRTAPIAKEMAKEVAKAKEKRSEASETPIHYKPDPLQIRARLANLGLPWQEGTFVPYSTVDHNGKVCQVWSTAPIRRNGSKAASKEGCEWMTFLSQRNGTPIWHQTNGKEVEITAVLPDGRKKRMDVDGYDPTTMTVYEFHGRQFHPNPLHWKMTDRWGEDEMVGEKYDKQESKRTILSALGFRYISVGEEEWQSYLRSKRDETDRRSGEESRRSREEKSPPPSPSLVPSVSPPSVSPRPTLTLERRAKTLPVAPVTQIAEKAQIGVVRITPLRMPLPKLDPISIYGVTIPSDLLPIFGFYETVAAYRVLNDLFRSGTILVSVTSILRDPNRATPSDVSFRGETVLTGSEYREVLGLILEILSSIHPSIVEWKQWKSATITITDEIFDRLHTIMHNPKTAHLLRHVLGRDPRCVKTETEWTLKKVLSAVRFILKKCLDIDQCSQTGSSFSIGQPSHFKFSGGKYVPRIDWSSEAERRTK